MHVLEANGQYGLVNTLTLVPGGMWMYNLTVVQDHTYVVGLDQWIVHNCPAGSRNWPRWNATPASVRNLGKSDPSVPQVVRDLAPDVAAAQNAAGGRQGGSKTSCCAGTFVITGSDGTVIDAPEIFTGKGGKGTGGIGGDHAESLEYQAAVQWLVQNAEAGVSYTVNFLNQYAPCDYGGCSTTDWSARLNAAALTRGATANGAFYVMSGTGRITQTFPGPPAPPDNPPSDPLPDEGGLVE